MRLETLDLITTLREMLPVHGVPFTWDVLRDRLEIPFVQTSIQVHDDGHTLYRSDSIVRYRYAADGSIHVTTFSPGDESDSVVSIITEILGDIEDTLPKSKEA